jgi:hypothetical protein
MPNKKAAGFHLPPAFQTVAIKVADKLGELFA